MPEPSLRPSAEAERRFRDAAVPLGLLPTLWGRMSWRHALSAPGQTALLVLILSLGIALYLSIRLANRAAVAGFEQFTAAVTGQSDFVLAPQAGSFRDAWLAELRMVLAPEPVELVPVVEFSAPRPRAAGDAVVGREAFRLLGVDLVASANLLQDRPTSGSYFARTSEGGSTDPEEGVAPPSISDALRSPAQVWIAPALARRDGLTTGDTLEVIIHDRIRTLTVAGQIPTSRSLPAPETTLLVMDLPALRVLAGMDGVDRVEVIVPEGPDLDLRRSTLHQRLESASAGRWQVETPASRRSTGETMTAAFRLNLAVLSLIALLVGLLLIVQALDGAVVRRRQEIAILRSLGVESSTVQQAWLLEAATIGLVAGVLGTLLGWLGAQFSVRLVARTVNALYYANTASAATPQAAELLAGVGLGVAASVIAGWIPARAAAAVPPAQLLARGHVASGLDILRLRWPAAALLLLGLLLLQLPPVRLDGGARFPLAGYLAALCGILGAGVLAGALFQPIAALARPLAVRFAPARIAVGHLRHPAGRARLALAGLVAAIGMSAGMLVLVGSFEKTVRGWIDENLRADLFVASDGAQNASSTSRIQPETWRRIAADPDVLGLELFAGERIEIEGVPTFLGAFGQAGDPPHHEPMWIDKPAVSLQDAHRHPAIAYASEAFAERFGVARASTVTVPTPAGPRNLRIDGIFADYGNDRGSLLVPIDTFQAWFGAQGLINFSVYLKPGASTATVRARWVETYPALRVLTNGALRTEVIRIFRQTFSITYALECIGVLVALAGLALSMASMLLDRRDELTTLRSLGFTPRELASAAAWEGAATSAAGAAVGLLLSLGLGYLLVFVINKQSFGWTLQLVVPVLPLLVLALAVIAAGTVVSWQVGRWSARLPADREE